MIGDSNVHVQVNGTTFFGIFEVVGPTLELTNPNFGDGATALGDEVLQVLAERMLRAVVKTALRRSTPFLRDDARMTTVIGGAQGRRTNEKNASFSLKHLGEPSSEQDKVVAQLDGEP